MIKLWFTGSKFNNPNKVCEEGKEIAGEYLYTPMYEFENFDINKYCYTHTVYLERIYVAVCHKDSIQPCIGIMK